LGTLRQRFRKGSAKGRAQGYPTYTTSPQELARFSLVDKRITDEDESIIESPGDCRGFLYNMSILVLSDLQDFSMVAICILNQVNTRR
jgi:hypothetical protein